MTAKRWPRPSARRARRTIPVLGALAGLVATVVVAGSAFGTPGNGKPEASVSPSTGLAYKQTIRVTGDDLPKGSGLIAATICGLNDAAGAYLGSVGADDCAGQADLSSGLVVLQENKDGTFDQPYTLPSSGQKFGKNQRFCDAKHHCAIVVADANPDGPAYYIPTLIQFADQGAYGGNAVPKTAGPPTTQATTTTTQAPPPTATASAETVTVGDTLDITGANWTASDADTTVGFVLENGARTTAPVTATVGADGALTASLTATFDDLDATHVLVEDATGDPATHRITIPVDVKPQPGPSGKVTGTVRLNPDDPQVRVQGRIVVAPPAGGDGGEPQPPLPPEVAQPVDEACAQLAQQLTDNGADATAITTACSALTHGGGGDQLQFLLRNPSALCLALAPAVGSDPSFVAGCNQALGSGGAGQVTPQIADGIQPLTDAMP